MTNHGKTIFPIQSRESKKQHSSSPMNHSLDAKLSPRDWELPSPTETRLPGWRRYLSKWAWNGRWNSSSDDNSPALACQSAGTCISGPNQNVIANLVPPERLEGQGLIVCYPDQTVICGLLITGRIEGLKSRLHVRDGWLSRGRTPKETPHVMIVTRPSAKSKRLIGTVRQSTLPRYMELAWSRGHIRGPCG